MVNVRALIAGCMTTLVLNVNPVAAEIPPDCDGTDSLEDLGNGTTTRRLEYSCVFINADGTHQAREYTYTYESYESAPSDANEGDPHRRFGYRESTTIRDEFHDSDGNVVYRSGYQARNADIWSYYENGEIEHRSSDGESSTDWQGGVSSTTDTGIMSRTRFQADATLLSRYESNDYFYSQGGFSVRDTQTYEESRGQATYWHEQKVNNQVRLDETQSWDLSPPAAPSETTAPADTEAPAETRPEAFD